MFDANDVGKFIAILFFLFTGIGGIAAILNKYVATPMKNLNETMIRFEVRFEHSEREQSEIKKLSQENKTEIIKLDKRVSFIETSNKHFKKVYDNKKE